MVLLSLWLIAAALVEVRTSADGQAGNEEMVQIDLPGKRQREYELVTPVSTSSEGHYLSHILSANHKKRSARDVSSTSEQLFFNITAFGRDFHLRLKPNTQLVAPGAVVEWQETSPVPGSITHPVNDRQPGSASERVWKTEPLQTNCAYVGDIMDIPGTSVAISNCDGLERQLPLTLSSAGPGGLERVSSIVVAAVVILGVAGTFTLLCCAEGCL